MLGPVDPAAGRWAAVSSIGEPVGPAAAFVVVGTGTVVGVPGVTLCGGFLGTVVDGVVAGAAYGGISHSTGRKYKVAVDPRVLMAAWGSLMPGKLMTTSRPCRWTSALETPRPLTRRSMMFTASCRVASLTVP